MASVETDVVIIGASIGGSAAAAMYAKRGVRVLLVDRVGEMVAYKKQCSHAIQPAGVAVLERMGVIDELEKAGGLKTHVQVWTKEGGWLRLGLDEERDELGRRNHGLNMRREKLDPILRSFAAAQPGVTLKLGLAATALFHDENGRVTGVELSDGTQVKAQLVVGADGRHTKIAAMASMEPEIRPHTRSGFMAYYRGVRTKTGNDAQFWILGESVAYAFPTDDGLVLLAAMVHESRFDEFRKDREGFLRALYASLPDGPDLSQAERVGDFVGAANTPNTYRYPVKPGLALVGDAAMATDYIWGAGCGWALQSAEFLVDNTAEAITRRSGLDEGLEAYAKLHKERLYVQHVQNTAFSASPELPLLLRTLFREAPHDERLRELMATGATGRVGPRDPRVLVRLAWVLMTKPFRPAREPAGIKHVAAMA